MTAILKFRRKWLIWLGASACLFWSRPVSAAENAPAPDLAGMKAGRSEAPPALGRLSHEGQDAEAAAALEQALASKPDDFEVEKELGPIYNRLGQYDKAARILEKALKQRPQVYFLTVELAKSYARMGRLESAKAAFARAKAINGKEASAYIEQGYAYLNSGHDTQAKQEFEALIAVDTANSLGYHHMGTYLLRHQRYHEAEEYYRHAVRTLEAKARADPSDLGHAFWYLGGALQAQGRFAEAEAVFRKSFETVPDVHWQTISLRCLGELADEQDKPAESEQFYKQAMAACESRLGCWRADWADAALGLGGLRLSRS